MMMDPSLLECPICQQSLLASMRQQCNSSAITSSRLSPVCTPCGHIFHRACITEWFRFRRQYDGGSSVRCSCPSCRKTIAYHKLIRVYLPISSLPSLDNSREDENNNATNYTAITTQPRTSTVAEAVRRYNQQHFPHADRPAPTTSNTSRIYNQFFTIYNGLQDNIFRGDQDGVNGGDGGASESISRGRVDFACENEDCVALHNVYQILSREFKSLQRKLELEIELSKMKSVIVTGLQRDMDQLRKVRENSLARPIGIFVLSLFGAWILGIASLMMFQ